MAVLNEADLKVILGADFRLDEAALQNASGAANAERALRGQMAMLDEKKSVSLYFSLLGVALILASVFSVTGTTLMIQCAVGAAILVLGLMLYGWYGFRLRKLNARAPLALAA